MSPFAAFGMTADVAPAEARKTGKCRNLRIRATCEITDAKGKPVIGRATTTLKTGVTPSVAQEPQ